jgi:hypothetical protein
MERPAQDQPQKYSRTGTTGGTSQSNGAAQQANRSVSLAPWFKEESPDEYIVQVHSGISFGAALLSTGRVLTWGLDGGWGAIGRDCGKQSDYPGSSSQRKAAYEACFYEPGPVDFSTLEVEPVIVSTSCSFTAVAALSEDGVLYGWGVPNRSYEGLPGALGDIDDYEYPIVSVFEGNGAVVILDTNVVKFQNGQGFVIWWDVWGKMWGQGWQENGQLGHHSGNWGRSGFYNETKRRWLWFTKPQYEDDCRYTHQTVNYGNQTSDEVLFRDSSFKYNGVTYNCKDLNKKKDDGTWLERFTFERWLAYLDCRDAGGDETTCTLST